MSFLAPPHGTRRKGIEPLIAAVIVTAVGITISVAVSLWMLGVIGSTGYGTRPIEIGISQFRALGPYAMIMLQNLGGETVYIDEIRIGNKIFDVVTAYEYHTLEPCLDKLSEGNYLISVGPGKLIEIWVLAPEDFEFKPGVEYRVSAHTTLGFSADKIIKASRWMLRPPTLDLYIRNRNVTYHIDFARLTWTVYQGSPDNLGTVLWSGSLLFTSEDKLEITDEVKQQPVAVVLNPKAGRGDFIVWCDHNNVGYEWGSGYYNLTKVDYAVPFLDFILYFEDLWNGSGSAGDADYNEHVTRVTWMRNGNARVAVYFGAHGYTLDVYVGGQYVYTITGHYYNIVDTDYNGPYGVDDLRAEIQDKIWIVKP